MKPSWFDRPFFALISPSSLAREILRVGLFGLFYMALLSSGLRLRSEPGDWMSMGAASGMGLTWLVLARQRGWRFALPGLFVANLCGSLLIWRNLALALGFAAAACLEAALISWLLGRMAESPLRFSSLRQVLAFFVCATFGNAIGSLLSAGLAVAVFGVSFGQAWFTNWIQHGLGLSLFTPLIICWFEPPEPLSTANRRKVLEGVLLVTVLAALVCYLFFLSTQNELVGGNLRLALFFPFLIWVGLRFDQRFVSALLVVLVYISIFGSNSTGKLSAILANQAETYALASQFYLGLLVFSTYVLSAALTERKAYEHSISTSEKRYRMLHESIRDGFVMVNLAGQILEFNTVYQEMLGYSAAELKQLTYQQLTPEKWHASEADIVERCILNNDSSGVYEKEYMRKDGSIFAVELHAFLIRNERGQPEGLWAIVRDITRRKQIEAALQQSAQQYEHITHTTRDGFWICDRQGQLLDVNPSICQMLGYSRDEMLGLAVQDIDVNESTAELVLSHIERVIAQGADRFEAQFRRKDGSLMDAEMSVTYMPEPGHFLAFVRDISARLLAERVAQARVRLVEFATNHSLDELLRATVDEAEQLTGSQVGFYHFVDADQNHLSLQNWSTRTLRDHCQMAQGKIHYAVDQAGVWADCLRERRALIHNDFASLPNRHGLPEGHAALQRELVIPVLRGDKVVCLLGVGNKPGEYTATDLEVAGQLADISWDIAERKRAEFALTESEALLNETQSISRVGGWLYNVATRQITWTAEVYRIYGVGPEYNPSDVANDTSPYEGEDRQRVNAAFEAAIQQGQPYTLEARFVNAQGQHLWVRTSGKALMEDGKVVGVIGNLMDITASRQAQEDLRRANKKLQQQIAANKALQALLIERATHDALTGLYNRRFLDDTLLRELSRAQREGQPVSVLMLDIDHFKSFNDTYGHEAGDQVLVALGELLRSHTRQEDVACRYGGEEFVVILPGASLADGVERAEQICRSFAAIRIATGVFELSATISVGVAAFPVHGQQREQLLHAADNAMYAAKQAGRNRVMAA